MSSKLVTKLVIVAAIAWSTFAAAGPPAMTTYDAKAFTVSLPKGWNVVNTPEQGMVVAQQDPKRKDAAQLLVIVSTSSTSTDDQVLDYIIKNALVDAKVGKREALPGGTGKVLVADGKVEGISARLGAIALSPSGGLVVGVLIAKTKDFDALGGTDTVITVLASLKVGGAPSTPAASEPAASGAARDALMTPEYAYGSLVIPHVQRKLELVDVVGEWNRNDGAAKSYVNSSGSYAGFSSVSTSETWTIDGKGNVIDAFAAAYVNGGGARGVKQRNTGTVTVNDNNTMSFHYGAQNGNKDKTENYIIVGWFVGPEMTILRVQGPFYAPITAKNISDNNSYMNETYVTKRAHP